jgi:leucine dehydrogenase
MFSHPDYDGHQELLFAHDADSGLRALIAVHDTTLGPAFGGCRMYPYASEHHAMADVLRLSRGMTYKAAICELPYGGGKSVIIADPRRDKTPALLHAMGRLVEDLGGRYIIADDVGTTLADLVVMRAVTRYTAAATAAAQQALPATAFGVFEALGAAAEVCLGRHDLEGLRVAVQGLGNVGMPLCGYLAAAGATLVVSDLDLDRCEQAAIAYGATVVEPEAIYTQHVDVFAPAALGGVLNDATIPHLRCRIVCGGANKRPARCGACLGHPHRRHHPRRAASRHRDWRHPVVRRGCDRPGADHACVKLGSPRLAPADGAELHPPVAAANGAHRCILLFAIGRRLPAPGNPCLIGGGGAPVNGRFGGVFADRSRRHRSAAERRFLPFETGSTLPRSLAASRSKAAPAFRRRR